MSDWYEVNKGEHYRHVLTRGLVCVTKVRWNEGITGLIYWEAIGGVKIDGTESGVQEAQHFLEDFYLVDLSPSVAAETGRRWPPNLKTATPLAQLLLVGGTIVESRCL